MSLSPLQLNQIGQLVGEGQVPSYIELSSYFILLLLENDY